MEGPVDSCLKTNHPPSCQEDIQNLHNIEEERGVKSDEHFIDGVNQNDILPLVSDSFGESVAFEISRAIESSDQSNSGGVMTVSGLLSSEASSKKIHDITFDEGRDIAVGSCSTGTEVTDLHSEGKKSEDFVTENNKVDSIETDLLVGTRSEKSFLESCKDIRQLVGIEESQDVKRGRNTKHLTPERKVIEADKCNVKVKDEVFVCFFCTQKFVGFEELEIHEQDHSDENPYRCSFCPRIFSCYDLRGKHERACRETKVTQVKTEVKQVPVLKKIFVRSQRGRHLKVKINYKETDDTDRIDGSEDVLSEDIKTSVPEPAKKAALRKIKVNMNFKAKNKKGQKIPSVKGGGTSSGCHVCALCSLSFTRISHLNRHLIGVHSVSWIPCKICKKMYETKEELNKHEQSHACDICGKFIKFDGAMIQHKLMHIREQQRKSKPTASDEIDKGKLQCKVCGMNFKYARSAREHEKRHFEPPIYKCVQCPRKFPTEEKRLSHQESCKPNPHQCKECGKTFKYRYQREMHLIEVHTGKYFECQMCGQKFSNKGTWRTHEKLHTKEKEFKCPVCKKAFHFQASLNDHHNQVHSNIKSFQCMFCGIGVKSKGALKKHEALHTGAIMFQCKHCDEQFNSRMKLSTHIQEKHTGRMFICKACGKGFTNARYLRNHEMIHTGEKPYKCPHCGMGFRRQHHVTQHIPRHFKQTKLLKSNDVNVAFQPQS